ncbi:hypothetical protein CE91St43_22810 [Oscillospiraceae bacterium]|nr:hypothetical protein CE91St43_22810 [Oscillospiraceae bacterium]
MIMNIQYPSSKEHKLYAVAYLDLLGTTEKIKNDEKGNYFLEYIRFIIWRSYIEITKH